MQAVYDLGIKRGLQKGISPEVLRQDAAGDFSVTRQIETAEGLEGDFLGGSVVKNLPANAGDSDLIPGSERPLE